MEAMDSRTQKIKKPGKSEAKMIPVICPWCNRLYSITKWEVELDRKIWATHGICPDCFKKIKKEND